VARIRAAVRTVSGEVEATVGSIPVDVRDSLDGGCQGAFVSSSPRHGEHDNVVDLEPRRLYPKDDDSLSIGKRGSHAAAFDRDDNEPATSHEHHRDQQETYQRGTQHVFHPAAW
jgi:hypothetical protein